ncbi:hypothetical protein LAZ67_9002779, partial [Cordylochernes scorpioides]
MAEELILRLKKKRAINRSYLTKTCNKIESGLDTLIRIDLEELLEQLNESFNELKLVDQEIETLLETDDLEKELQGVEEYREKYITWRFRANKKIRQSDFHGENIPNSNSRIDENEMRHYVPSCTTVKLPKLMISKFYGNFSEWLTFWNSFDAAIHQNNSLNPIDKFNYLKSHLGGTVLNTVEGFALSADNYEKAIKLLKDRFGREDILISRHMNNLLSMRPLKTSSDVRTFRELFDNLSVQIRSLESLNLSIDVYGQLLCPIIIKLLPADLNLELNKELPTGYVINDLITFLERQLTAREKSFRNEIGDGNESTSKPKTRFYNEKPIATASELLNSVHKSNECVFCGKDNHGSPKCDFAANMSLNEKRSLMRKKGVCYKCLRPSHLSKFCRNVVRCSICNMSSHLDVMCTKRILDRGGSSKSPTVQDETLANLSTSPDALLPTLRVTLKGNRTEKTARAIIDTGSQRSYILHSTAMEMEYEQSRREFFRHSLFGGSSTDVVEHEVYTIHLSDINNSYRCEFEALGQPLICGSIPPVCPRSFLEGSEELDVSDLMRDRIEVLIGADIAGRLLTNDQRRISSGLVAIRTKLGWTVMGKIPPTEVRDDISSLCVTTLLSLDLENLWKLDAIGVSDAEVEKKTQSLQAEMEEHFAHTTTRDIEGRYEVALPWVQDKERIPSNKDLAENQLSSVRRKLEEVGDMNEYGQIFEEWMKQGIIEYAREDKLDGVHYLPHRPVYKRNSHTSRIRPVFNASARKRGKLSLNDCLDKGPNLIEIIPRLLNKFRKYEVGVSSDIEKAFLQIGIKEEDRDYLRFLWHTEDGRLITYRHKRVVFGITTSPYLLKATLSLYLDKAPEHLKTTAEQLKSSFYVDNCLSSFQNVEETEKFGKQSTELLSTACFNLRDWVSNVTDFSLMNPLNKEVNILGITWNTDRDTLTIGLEDFELIGPTTKRKVLSIASKIFDPLGVACPVTLIPKLILQETWIQKLTWDEVLPGCLVQRFWKWFSKLKHLPNIEIPRWLCFKDSYVEKTTLHIFCDASQFAYATCIFLRIEKEDRVDIQLIQARTRVAPLKKLTIPRLELLACLIGARLAANIIQDLEFEEIPRFYWTDSTNALCWIQREDNWAAFVMNRVKEIHNLSSPESWRHIPGRLNPADLPSRGCSAESLKETRWWEGPAWLKVSQEEWPKSTIIPNLEIVYSERRKTILNTLCTTRENENLFGRYSHFLRIVRITAWIYRFFNNAKIDRRKIISEDLSTEEITKSEIILIRLIQRESFSRHEDKKLQGFKLLVDSSGILRIKTKICRREDFANFRMPILLPSDHFLVSLLIRWNHETHGHAGLQTLLGILRENYWILRSRKTVKKIINQCIRCKRFTATPATVESTSLPEDRVRDAVVFEIVGVDLTGHLILKNKKKAWIVIFTCAVYRGVHLELVTSLSMEAFLQAFRRFIARRGRPLIVYSDNGTNFKGMANALKKIDFSRLKCDPTLKNITWKFIPPGAPWWGGWWERLIGMMKQLLFRILGQTSLGYEELSTVMCDVESLMNTRPLTYLTEESEDLAPLTPSLFLHEVREVGVPDLDLIDNQTLSRKYHYIKRVREDLRERFRIEYFGFLRQETRRLKTTIPFKVGDMVLIGQESLKRLHWPLARIIQLYPGKDGLVRVAKVKTSSGDKIRPIQKLYNLEITPEIRCRDPLTERSPTQEVRLTTEEDPLTSQQEQHHIDTPNVVSSYGRPIKRPNRLDLLNFSFPCLSRRDANSKEIKDLESEKKAIVESKNIHGLKLFQQEVNERKISLNQVINTLLESELDDTQYDDYSKAKKDIFNMLVSIEEALSLIETKENTHSDKQLPESNVNLPKINLPIFNGDSANWLSFREIFNSTINSNQTLTEIQKFQYLNASVKGPAEKLIRGFPISDKNYQQAWDTLCNRFNNKRELAFSQINKIFSIRPLKSISAGSLYEILDVCNEGIRNLSVLGLEKNTLTDLILINFFEKRIGEALRKEWELTLQNEEYPTFENFVNFLEKHARSLQGMRIPLFQEQKTSSKNMMAHGLYVNKGQNCILCHQIHKLNDCHRFINLPLPKKWELVKKHKLCQNCLRANHEISKCLITSRCKNCKQNHHTLLHEYNSEPSIPQPTTSQEMLISTNTICNAMPLETETNILLSTALIKVKAKDGSFVLCRALVDNGSQISLISEQCCHKLGLEKRKNSYTLKGVGDIVVNWTTSQVEIEFTPHHNDQLFSARAFVVGRVTADLPNFQIQSADFPHLENLLLADPEFYVTKPIDLILGADTFVEIILGHKTDLKHHPIALNTKLGWLVSGRIHSTIKSNTSVINHCTTELDSSIRKFWELEDVPISKAQLGTKNACEILFKSNLKRDIEGRYSVNLPFKSTPNLGDSRSQALEKGLQENPSKSEDNPSKSEEIPSKSKKSRISKLTPQITSKQNQLLPSESSQPSTPEQPLASQSSEPLSSKKETSIIPKIKPPPYYRRKCQLPAEKTSWDEPIESDIKSNWNKFQTQLSCLKEIKIPRYLNSSSSEIEELQLHGFCDASLNAYSAVFYLKNRFKIQKIKINLITSKTKVAPLKTITIPRLELSAALLLAQLNQVILESFPFQPDKTFLWTDSQICIDWIRSDASRWKAFVSNRVSSIQNLTQITDWFHVSSQDNPADCASRGIMPQDLVNHRIWWRGPIWLQENNVRYIPSSPTQVNLNIIQEEVGEGQVLDQTTLIQNSETMLNLEFIERYSTMTKLIRITAWCWRFYYNCLLFNPIRQKGPLTTRELTKAIQVLVKSIQQVEFCTEIKLLKSNKQLPLSNKLTSLNPFLDTQGLLRVGGRLKYSYLNENQNFPLLQPKPPRQESLIKNLLTENADIPEAIDENQEDSSILETTFVIEDEESNKDIGTPKIEISEVSVIDKSEGKYSKEPVVSAEALDKKELCHDDSAHLNVVEADLNRPKEATSGIINVYTEANESSSKEKVVPVEIGDTSTKDYLQSGEKAKLSRWKPIDSLCLEEVKESEDDDENYSSSAYIEWPEILKKEVLRPEALEKAVNLEDFEKAAE